MAKRDYYEVIGVGRDASDDEIKKSYRKLALKFHHLQHMLLVNYKFLYHLQALLMLKKNVLV